MYQVLKIHLHKDDPLYPYCRDNAALAKLLYNASLFRIRQIFTGWEKVPEQRSANEQEVFQEVALLEAADPSVHVRHVISYFHLEKLLRVTQNPDYLAGLPAHCAQHVVKRACEDFKNWLKSLKAWKKHPENFLGKPKMPHYKKADLCTFTSTNQECVLYPKEHGGYDLKLPLTKQRLALNTAIPGTLKEVKVKPWYGDFVLSVTMEVEDVPARTDLPNLAAIDFGTDNIAAFVCTDQTSVIYKGGAVLSENRRFAKERARRVGMITKGHTHMYASSHKLDSLSKHHSCFNLDQMHKISRDIINRCLEHQAGTLILGVNKNWKQNANLGTANNQKFASVPIAMLRQLITYKAAMAGITVIEQEESYTSKTDITAMDPIPVYGQKGAEDVCFSGKRICRGLYRCHNGMVVNADCLGAANILRKAIPDAWKDVTDFGFLASPDVSGFHELNPSSKPVKRLVAA